MFEAILGAVAPTLIGGLLGGASSSGGSPEKVTTVNEPWPGIQPYLLGDPSGTGYTPGQKPISSDWLQWMYLASIGQAPGPPPPMYVDDPRYTGKNVYDAPFQYQSPMANNMGLLGDPNAPNVPTAVWDQPVSYPSSAGPGPSTVTPEQPQAAPPQQQQGPDPMVLERAIAGWLGVNSMSDGNPPDRINAINALSRMPPERVQMYADSIYGR